jgi:hypothetical protein
MRKQSRCKSRTKAGKPCGAAATAGGLCFFHANPNKASKLGRIGGRSKRHTPAESRDPLPPLDNAIAVRDTAARLIADVIAGKVHPRVAAGLAPLMESTAARDQDSGYRAAPREVGAGEAAGRQLS